MKILVDCSQLIVGGGVQVGLSFLLKASTFDTFNIIVIASKAIDKQLPTENKESFHAYHVIDSNSPLQKALYVHKFHKWERKYKPDLIFTVFGPSMWRSKAPCIQGFALGLMFYPEVQDILKYSFTKKVGIRANYYIKQRLFKKNADYFIVETEIVKSRLCNLFNIPFENVYVIENSYSPYFTTDFESNRIKSKDDYFELLVPSSYYPHKNLEVLTSVVDILLLNNRKVRFNFMLDTNSYKQLINQLTLPESCKLMHNLGRINSEDLPYYYDFCDAVILPTLAESSTSAYPEAFFSKKVLLTSDRDFARYLCGDAAIYFDPLNPEDIYNKIINVIENPSLALQKVKNANIQLRERYISSEEKWVKQKDLLTSLAQQYSNKQSTS